ncbi:FkbM family methyltransferase [Pontibacter anaerobius]|uniref:FkbM family methyltransferase n=1 Tax=Pontibacter anaerobius TaxID=2993940 RepID=A0ABT3RL71_9BACT|nr:FkbM family methyltransferase [Pontibacter anaerobius]MCX2742206.1 FkbM family methyltransferase [Pontibacter anaerobius]
METLPHSLKALLVQFVKSFAPSFYWRSHFNFLRQNFREDELHLLPYLCNPKMISVDVGAANGVYTVHMLDYSKSCIAFEPRHDEAHLLKTMLASVTKNALVEAVGLSDKSGEAILKTLIKDLGRSTIEKENSLEDNCGSDRIDVSIPIRTLDEYNLNEVGHIKIDVEGHELSVLKGARRTIINNYPTLLIEIEERHKKHSIEDVSNFLAVLGYSGFFLFDGKVTPLSKFNCKVHQDSKNVGNWRDGYQKKGMYINNFAFIPSSRLDSFLNETSKLMITQ